VEVVEQTERYDPICPVCGEMKSNPKQATCGDRDCVEQLEASLAATEEETS